MQSAFKMLSVSENVDAAVEAFSADLTAGQPQPNLWVDRGVNHKPICRNLNIFRVSIYGQLSHIDVFEYHNNLLCRWKFFGNQAPQYKISIENTSMILIVRFFIIELSFRYEQSFK